MNKTLRTAIPLLLLVGLALMTPTAAAEPEDLQVQIRPIDFTHCRIVEARTTEISTSIVTVHSQYVCI